MRKKAVFVCLLVVGLASSCATTGEALVCPTLYPIPRPELKDIEASVERGFIVMTEEEMAAVESNIAKLQTTIEEYELLIKGYNERITK